LKSHQLKALERLYRRRVDPDTVVSTELAREMGRVSGELNRQVGVLIDRTGKIEQVIVGDHKKIVIPALPHIRVAGGRLKGLRCVHTHLGDEKLTEDDLLDLLFLRLDLMAALTLTTDHHPALLHAAHLQASSTQGESWHLLEPEHPARFAINFREMIAGLEAEFARLRPIRAVDKGKDRALLISVTTESKEAAMESMDELVELAASADVVVLETIIQRRHRINPKWILGKGKLGEIMLIALRTNANLLLFDQELNPSQIRSITDHTELRVIDRTQLILDIFARRARSREGKLQIEMAQLKYMLPRLTLRDDALSRLTGGIGGRGPGETRLEIDRRRINDRLAKLAQKLKGVARERHQRRSRRRKKELPVLSLVGYTNAGKSTLLNSLTKSDILAEDKLFATLDPTSRRLKFPQDMEVIVTDTVGFIRDLPDELLKAFRATLEELDEADVLLHVVDLANPRFEEQLRVVEDLLDGMGLAHIPTIRIFNKIDLIDSAYAATMCARYDAVGLSAMHPETFTPLLAKARRTVIEKWRGVAAEGNCSEGMTEEPLVSESC